MRASLLVVLVMALAVACGCGSKSNAKAKDDAAPGPPAAPIATPTIGLDTIRRFNFPYENGKPDYDRAANAYQKKPRDWAGVKQWTESSVAKDPFHLGAHRLLASALANLGDPAAAADHLVTVLAGDYYGYAAGLGTDEDLKEFRTTQHGTAIAELAVKLKAEYGKRVATALLVVGRRSWFKLGKPGTDFASSRGELYAYDRETKRYLRLTHTDHQVAGFVRSASGGDVVLLGFDKVDRPKPPEEGPAVFARAWIELIDGVEWTRIGQRINLAGPAREVSVGYGAGDQLLIATAPANGRWGIGPQTVSSLDRSTSKLTKVTGALPVPRVVLSLEEGRVVRDGGGVKAAWTGDPPTAPSLTANGPAISVPESGAAAQSTVVIAPGGARLAFATAVDPCAKDAAPSLYIADTKSGALKHLLTSKSRFTTRWLDATTLAYEDGDGAIRLFDTTAGREALKLENRWGLALDVLSPAPAPLCKQAPPAVDAGSGSGDDPVLPPEEGSGSGGPVTQPQ